MLHTISKILAKIQLSLGFFGISVFFIVVLLQVFSRYLQIYMPWTEEVATYSFIWSVFMGAGAMVFEKGHFCFTLLLDRISNRSRLYLMIVIDIIILIFTIFVLYFGIIITYKFWNYRLITLSAVKMGYIWMSIPFFGICTSFYSITHIVENLFQLLKKKEMSV